MKELRVGLSLVRMWRGLHNSPEHLRQEQTRKLRRIVHHAYFTTPYYRKLFDAAGIRPEDIRSLPDLSRIPISRKEDLLKVPLEDRIARGTNLRNCQKKKSSGTTGTVWDILISPSEKLRRDLKAMRAMLVNGYRFWYRICTFRDPRMPPEPGYWFQHLGLLRLKLFSSLDEAENKLAILCKGDYDVIFSRSSGLLLVAEAILERGIVIRPPKMVVTEGELMDPAWRNTIREAFQRDPTDLYGSVEFGSIAWQCRERQGYHVDADHLVLELVKEGTAMGPGEEGEVVISDLAPRAMPLIRFATGDLSSISVMACSCGITLPTLSHISGRKLDFLLLPSGKKVAPKNVVSALDDIPGIRSFKVTQVSRSEVVVTFTRRPGASEDPSPVIRERLRGLLGGTMETRVEESASLPSRAGKFRIVENALPKAAWPT